MGGGKSSQVVRIRIAVWVAAITVSVWISKLIVHTVVVIRKSPVVVSVPVKWIAVRAEARKKRFEIRIDIIDIVRIVVFINDGRFRRWFYGMEPGELCITPFSGKQHEE